MPVEPRQTPNDARVADARPGNLFDAMAPGWAVPYGHLARFDRPIGAWLLLFPCWWGQALGELSLGHAFLDLWYLLLFLVGAFVMRGAGCTHNDIVDREFDAKVARTASRPIPSGQVSVQQAIGFALLLCAIGFLVLIQFNAFTIGLGILSLGLVAAYPFAKRYTHWAQLVLGLTFKWGALVGFAAVTGRLGLPAILLYLGSVAWTIGYDTIYAHQDKEDDALLKLKSTALLFGDRTAPIVGGFYAAGWLMWFTAANLAGAGIVTITALGLVALQMAWQIATLDISNPDNCLQRFKSNRYVGWLFFAGLVLEMVLVNSTRLP